jgi:two-component system, sensor histidine kinase and response regulator
MLNRLISVISHDVRGPVASSAAALRMITESRLDESTRDELLRNMLDTLDSTADLLTEIMIWIESRSYSTSIERLMRKVDMNSLLQNVIKLYSGQIIQKQISLKLDLRDEICEAYTEPNTMKIVLRNIISNAVKFTPEAGQISIFCAPVQDYIQIRIKDNGCGMSKEEIDKLLKQKMHSQKGSCQEIGMGMGLRLSLGYLKLLDAELKIASVPQQGSEFIINIKREK